MVIFINDRPIHVISTKKFWGSPFALSPHTAFDCQEIKKLPLVLDGNCIFLNVNEKVTTSLMKQVYENEKVNFQSMLLVSNTPEAIEELIKAQFRVIKAAGGVVRKEDKTLLMLRLGKWDFPKGKRDAGENSRQTAMREVQEECSIELRLGEKICTTWHTYSHKGNRILKRTKWYNMICTDDTNMKPQTEEGIERLEWKNAEELAVCLENSYQSIRYVAKMAGL